ncbi:MAG: C39 family peptidase [Chloroflexi bacterium]|nr:C39 family peptidase [Chloroflexota bacterium]
MAFSFSRMITQPGATSRRMLPLLLIMWLALSVPGLVRADGIEQGSGRATISGVVFRDDDGDGARSANEPGLPGVQIGVTAPEWEGTVATDGAGRFELKKLGADKYVLKVTIPNGLVAEVTGLVVTVGEGETVGTASFPLRVVRPYLVSPPANQAPAPVPSPTPDIMGPTVTPVPAAPAAPAIVPGQPAPAVPAVPGVAAPAGAPGYAANQPVTDPSQAYRPSVPTATPVPPTPTPAPTAVPVAAPSNAASAPARPVASTDARISYNPREVTEALAWMPKEKERRIKEREEAARQRTSLSAVAPTGTSAEAVRYALGKAKPNSIGRKADGDDVWLSVPFRTQVDADPWARANCGPASLAMVLDGYGVSTSTGDLRTLSNSFQGLYSYDQGIGLDALGKIAEIAGLRTVGPYREGGRGYAAWSLDDIRNQVRQGRPVITLTKYYTLPGHGNANTDTDHWIVITGTRGEDFIYNDAAYSGTNGYGMLISPGGLLRAWQSSSIPHHAAAFALGPGGDDKIVGAGAELQNRAAALREIRRETNRVEHRTGWQRFREVKIAQVLQADAVIAE